jgi:hypothetical protein
MKSVDGIGTTAVVFGSMGTAVLLSVGPCC